MRDQNIVKFKNRTQYFGITCILKAPLIIWNSDLLFLLPIFIVSVLQIRRGNKDNLGIISHLSIKTYFVTHHKNRLIETVLMRGHNICFIEK